MHHFQHNLGGHFQPQGIGDLGTPARSHVPAGSVSAV
jgi:hypothetical protein